MTVDPQRSFPSWDERYQQQAVETMPWFYPELDDDLKQALDELKVHEGECWMNIVDKAIQTHLTNIQAKTEQTLDQLRAVLQRSGLTKHGEIRAMFQRDLGLGYGDANMLTQALRDTDAEATTGVQAAAPDNSADSLYAGAKAALRPIHDRLMAEIEQFGAFEVAPKKSYLSLRRKKQFAMIGPATNTRRGRPEHEGRGGDRLAG